MKKKDIQNELGFQALNGFVKLVNTIPEKAGERTLRAMANLVMDRFGVRKEIILGNIRTAFPNKPDTWVADIATKSIDHMARMIHSVCHYPSETRASICAKTTLIDEHYLVAELAKGKGVILVTGHCGNWELGGSGIAAHGYPVHVIMAPLNNPKANDLLIALRRKAFLNLISSRYISEDVRDNQIGQALDRNEIVVFFSDQDVGERGVWVPFFGKLASTAKGAAKWALKREMNILPVLGITREKGVDVCFQPPIELPTTGTRDEKVYQFMSSFAGLLEGHVKLHPEIYFWPHKRWNRRPRPEYFPPELMHIYERYKD